MTGVWGSRYRPGFLGFALQKTSLLDLELPVAVEVIRTFSKCSRWTRKFEKDKVFWPERESVTPSPCPGSALLLQTLGSEGPRREGCKSHTGGGKANTAAF